MRIFVRWWEVSREGSVRYSSSRTISGTNTARQLSAITSKMNKAKLPTHIEINASAYDIVRDSVILLEQLRTIDKKRLKDKICHLDPEALAKVNKALKISLELPT